MKSVNSYPVSSTMQLIQCSADYQHDSGVVFSLLNEDNQLFVISICDGKSECQSICRSCLSLFLI